MTDAAIWIWFQLMFGIGTRRSHALMEYFPDPTNILEGIEKRNRVLTMLREAEITSWQQALRRAEELKRRTLRKGCDIVTPDHPAYPPLLRNIHAKPAALYVKGDLSCLNGTLVIAMVGTRLFTDYGRDAGRKLAGELAECGVVIVSGLARGIDSICHTAALKAGGKSIGILGCGIDIDYPRGSAQLKRNLAENGAVVSEYPLGTEPMASNFPLRNRIISGMSDGTIVVEADLKSGSLLTAGHALDQNRELFAIPGSIFSIREQGTHKLIREGAKLTESAADVFEEFSYREYPGLHTESLIEHKHVEHKTEKNGKAQEVREINFPTRTKPEPQPDTESKPEESQSSTPVKREAPEGISANALEVYELVEDLPKTVEAIAAGTSLDILQIQSALTELEIYGLIKGYPGRQFSV